MKKTDIAMVLLISLLSVGVSYLVVRSLPIFKDTAKPIVVQTVDGINSEVMDPDPAVFNERAINPTVEVFIGSTDDSDDE